MAGATYLTPATFNNQAFGFYGPESEGASTPSGVTCALDGTKHFHTANYVDDDYVSWPCQMDDLIFATLKGYQNSQTAASLVTSYGTCTAVLVQCDRVPTPGDPVASSAVHRLLVNVTFQRRTAWN